MAYFVVKVTFTDGDLAFPITVAADSEQEAVDIVRSSRLYPKEAKIESKGVRSDVMKAAFGDQPTGAIVIRYDWIWMGDNPNPKPK